MRRRFPTRLTGLGTILLVALQASVSIAQAPQPILLKDINLAAASSTPGQFVEANGVAFFQASDGPSGSGIELWRSDGTEAGTVLVKDIRLGSSPSEPGGLTNVAGKIFFVANDGLTGRELWRSDGTAVGTQLVKDIAPGGGRSNPDYLTNVNGTLFFSAASDGISGIELWRSDGTAAGTVMVKDIRTSDGSPSGISSSNPQLLTNVNGTLFFSASDGVNGVELWRSDGTAAGTMMVKDINPGAGDSGPQLLTNVNGTLFFTALIPGVTGIELWRSDGTEAGTVMVKDINPGTGHSFAAALANVSGTLFFRANDGVHGHELWRSDGSAAGTVLVKDIWGGIDSSVPSFLTTAGGTLLFRAMGASHGFELWKSDGTSAGTVLVKDIFPGASSSNLQGLTEVNGKLLFTADDGTTGLELWSSDGTEAGTALVKDIRPGSDPSQLLSPREFRNVNGTLFFSADDGVNGREPWALALVDLNTAPIITAGAPLTRQQGSAAGGPATIATVSDAETVADDLVGSVQSLPAGFAIGTFVNTGGTIQVTVQANCGAAVGANAVTLAVNDGSLMATADLTVHVTVNTPPALGTYASTILSVGSAATVLPTSAPADNGAVNAMSAIASAGFTGTLTPDLETAGVVIVGAGPVGTYTVTVAARDNCGATTTTSFALRVADSTPPEIVSVTPSTSVLWPPNRQMVPVTMAVSARDDVDPNPTCKVISVTSSDPITGRGDNTAPDWAIVGALSVTLRAERPGAGNGRVYTLSVECQDASGNASTAPVIVTVPHDRGAGR